MVRLLVEASAAGQRLDHFVAAALPAASVHGARRLIADGGVRVDGRRPRKGERLAAGQLVDIEDGRGRDGVVRAPVAVGAAISQAIEPDLSLPLEVIYLDEAMIAIAKPAGVPSHPLRPGETGTAANALVARFPECATASADPREGGLAHRLDTDTSGVLLAARNPEAWALLRAALGAPSCEKTYLAEVAGAPPDRGAVDMPIGRRGRRGSRVLLDRGRHPLPARTEWEVIARADGTALLRARLHAGRAHQVRAHLAAAGHPILGDATYGDDQSRALASARGVTGLRLHAASVSLRHPVSGVAMSIDAPPPAWAVRNR
jgi:23S rRNA pseudouridine1911/1915/1917 synthase